MNIPSAATLLKQAGGDFKKIAPVIPRKPLAPCGCQMRLCLNCHEPFWINPHQRRHKPGKVCGKKCQEKWNALVLVRKVKRRCLVCLTFFEVHASRIKHGFGKFCSTACYRKAGRVDRKCLICERPFTIIASQVRIGAGKFCGRRCQRRQREALWHDCSGCGKTRVFYPVVGKKGLAECSWCGERWSLRRQLSAV